MPRDDDDHEQRALRSIEAIGGGADIGEEALALSNEFTDRQTTRLTTWLRTRFRRS